MTLEAVGEILFSVIDTADRGLHLLRRNGDLRRQQRGEGLLATEAAPRHVLEDVDIPVFTAQHTHHRVLDAVRALTGTVDEHFPVLLRLRHKALRLQVGVLLIPGLEFLLDDAVRLGEGLLRIPVAEIPFPDGFRGLAQVEHRIQRLIVDFDLPEDAGYLLIVRTDDHPDCLSDIFHGLITENGKVIPGDHENVIAPGDIPRVHVTVSLRQLRQFHRQDFCPRHACVQELARQNGPCVSCRGIVVHKNAFPADFRFMILFHHGPTDCVHPLPTPVLRNMNGFDFSITCLPPVDKMFPLFCQGLQNSETLYCQILPELI